MNFTKFLTKLWSKPPVPETPVPVQKYEFITNPPAKELAEANRLVQIEKNKKERAERKILEKLKFIKSIDDNEKDLNSQIKNAIQNGDFSIRIKSHSLPFKLKIPLEIKSYYLAARRFRNRGFKVTFKTITFKDYPDIYYFNPGNPREKQDMYFYEVKITWN